MASKLVCPSCSRSYAMSERFCEDCRMPLVRPERGESPATERRRRARKINPLYAEGPPVRVARAANLAQAEMIAGMLLEEGIPCMFSSGRAIMAVYAPVAAPRDVLVPESGAEAAREALAWSAEHGKAVREAPSSSAEAG
ncbi:MAG TPA: DUF2007 domain-containing protein [Solirubrobacteraceae bacterium]|nr:DUF2007 domain-containing protein [Solirubrobacteraceae bacterium]